MTDKKEGSEVIEEKDVYIGYCDCFDGFEGGSCNESIFIYLFFIFL